MTKDPVVNLKEEKHKRRVQALIEGIKNYQRPGLDVNLVHKRVGFSGAAFGYDGAARDRLALSITEISDKRSAIFALSSLRKSRIGISSCPSLRSGLRTLVTACRRKSASRTPGIDIGR